MYTWYITLHGTFATITQAWTSVWFWNLADFSWRVVHQLHGTVRGRFATVIMQKSIFSMYIYCWYWMAPKWRPDGEFLCTPTWICVPVNILFLWTVNQYFEVLNFCFVCYFLIKFRSNNYKHNQLTAIFLYCQHVLCKSTANNWICSADIAGSGTGRNAGSLMVVPAIPN